MNLIDIIVLVIIAVLIGLAIAFIIRAKKRGQKCIGCPYSGQCSSAKKATAATAVATAVTTTNTTKIVIKSKSISENNFNEFPIK